MFTKVGRSVLKNLLLRKTRKTTLIRNITAEVHHLVDYKSNFSQLVSYDDKRLQKHLQYLNELVLNSHSNIISKCDNYQNPNVLNHIISLMRDIEISESELDELNIFISDLEKQKDELLNTAMSEKKSLENKLEMMKNEVLNLIIPEEIIDDKDIIMELSPGVGGQEAMLFAKDMFEMYCHYAQWKGWNCEIFKYDTTDLGGLRSAHIGINGPNAFKILKYECGVHRVQRVPKTEKAGRIHTSTMTVAVLPQPSEIDIMINPNDIEVQFKHSSGAGGQNVNKTESCVRIIHKSTGIVTESQMERDQHKNKALAMKALRAKLYERELEAVTKETKSSRKSQVGNAARSEKVRTYNFAQDRITDHRAHLNVYDVESFFRGEDELDRLLAMLQDWSKKQTLIEILNKYDST